MLNTLEGKWLQTFVVVYEQRSLSKAAERLGYVQSTITTHIQLLERTLGRKLFNRLPRGVAVTEAGEQLSLYAYQFLRLGEAMKMAMSLDSRLSGTVKLQVLESFCVSYLPAFFTQFFEAYQQVRLELTTGFYKDTLKALLERRIHLGMVPRDPERTDVAFVPLLQEELIFVAAPELTLKLEDGSSRNELKLISFGGRCIYQSLAEDALQREWGLIRYESVEYASLEMIRQLVIQGFGLALLPRITVEQELQSGKLVVLRFQEKIMITHGLITNKETETLAAVNVLQQALLDRFRV